MASIIPQSGRLIGTIIPDLIIEESTTDQIELTSHPVQNGAFITDHKYKKPTTLKLTMLQGGDTQADLADRYKALLDLQNGTDLFDVTTPKRIYKNMQVKSLACTTDSKTENVLSITAELQEVVIVSVSVTNVPPREQHKKPEKTGNTEKTGTKNAKVETDKKKVDDISVLDEIKNAIKSIFKG